MGINKTYVNDIFIRLDYLAAMSRLIPADKVAIVPDYINELGDEILIELADLNKAIHELDKEIKRYTPTDSDYDNVRNIYNGYLNTNRSLLTETQKQLESVENSLSAKQEQLESQLEEENSLVNKIEESQKILNVLKDNKTTTRQARTSSSVTELERNIGSLEGKLSSLRKAKARSEVAIEKLNQDKTDLTDKIIKTQEEIKHYELMVSAKKYLEDYSSIVEKKEMANDAREKKAKLVSKKNELEHTPIYLANTIKEKIQAQAPKEEVVSLFEELLAKVNDNKQMNTIIRNGNADSLKAEYSRKLQAYKALESRITKKDYRINKSEVETIREESINKAITLKKDERNALLNIVNNIENTTRTFVESYNNSQEITNDTDEKNQTYFEKIDTVDDSQDKANMKMNYQKMQKIAQAQNTITERYPEDIIALTTQKDEYNNRIKKLDEELKVLENEQHQINTQAKVRKGYVDVISKGIDEQKLAKDKNELNWLENRLRFSNYNITQLATEIRRGINSIYPEAKKRETNNNAIEDLADKPVKSPKLEGLKPAITAIENLVDKLGEIRVEPTEQKKEEPIKTQVSAKDVTDSRMTFESLLNLADQITNTSSKGEENMDLKTPTELDLNALDISFDLGDLEEEKQEQSVVANNNTVPIDLETFTFDLNPQESVEQEQNDKIKVIKVEPALKQEEAPILENDKPIEQNIATAENAKIKVVNIEPLYKKEENPKIKVVKVEQLNKQQDQNVDTLIVEPKSEQKEVLTETLDINSHPEQPKKEEKQYGEFIFSPFDKNEQLLTRKVA